MGKSKNRNILNEFWRIIYRVVVLGMLGVPFAKHFLGSYKGQLLWYLLATIFVVWAIVEERNYFVNKVEESITEFYGRIGSIPVLMVTTCFFVANYYDKRQTVLMTVFWGILVSILHISFNCWHRNMKEKKKNGKKEDVLSLLFAITTFTAYDLFFLAIVKGNEIFTWIIGTISVVILFCNLTNAFLKTKKKVSVILMVEMLIGLGIIVYLIYIIPDYELRNIILTIVAAIVGGMITLIGVAWTIKDAQIQRMENNRIEKQPYLQVEPVEWEERKGGIVAETDILVDMPQISEENGNAIFSKGIRVNNIGLGVATDVKCKWSMKDSIGESSLRFSVLQCGSEKVINVLGSSTVQEYMKPCIRMGLTFFFKDLLGNEYEQNAWIEWTVVGNLVVETSWETKAPNYLG